MLYISLEYILSSIQQLKNVHTFIGITFLTCKKSKLPIETPVTFPMDNNTKLFMDDVHKICPSSSHYFQPYQTNAKKQWLAPKYPSAGLQAINTQTFKTAFIHDRNGKSWAWSKDYVQRIQEIAIPKPEKRVPIFAMAIWTLKNHKWPDTATLEDIVEKFVNEYHLTKNEISALFSNEQSFPNVAVFQNTPVTWNQLSVNLSSPPDALPDQEGTPQSLN